MCSSLCSLLLFVVGIDILLIRRMKIDAHETAPNRMLYDYFTHPSAMTFFSSSFVTLFFVLMLISLLLHLVVVVIDNLLEG